MVLPWFGLVSIVLVPLIGHLSNGDASKKNLLSIAEHLVDLPSTFLLDLSTFALLDCY